jgi:lipopolysaccharide export system protein LptA
VVNQEGNTLRAEVVTYLIEEDRFVATPRPSEQVEAVYNLPPSAPASGQPGGPGVSSPPAPRPPTVLDVSPVNGANGSPGPSPESPPLGN